MATNFEDIVLWQKAHQFVLGVYRLSESFPKHELYGLTSQLRRAAVAIPANFAEGFGKPTRPDKLRFYSISQGSIEECRYYLRLVQDLGYGETKSLTIDLIEVGKMLGSYMAKIRADL
jgi:four helix bundle protein